MKKVVLLIAVLCSITMTQAQREIPSAVYTALNHLNAYLITPIELDATGVEWDWSVVGLDDFGDDCREREATTSPLPHDAYDIHFYRLAEHYHYRVSIDEQLIVPCLPMVDVPANTLPQVVDALSDLNRRLHLNLTPNDLPWRWREVQFEDYTLGCPNLTPPEETFDQTMNGYIITFTVRGEQYEYRVSSDRLIVMLCEDVDAE